MEETGGRIFQKRELKNIQVEMVTYDKKNKENFMCFLTEILIRNSDTRI